MKIKYQLITPILVVIAIFSLIGLIINLNIISIEEANTQVVKNFDIDKNIMNYENGVRNLQFGAYLYVYENREQGKQLIDNGSTLMGTSSRDLKTLFSDPINLSELSEIEKIRANVTEATNDVVMAVENNQSRAVTLQKLSILQERVDDINLKLSNLSENTHSSTEYSIEQSKTYVNSAKYLTYYAGFIALAVSLLVSLLMAEYISRPLRKLTRVANKVSMGDMNSKVDIKSDDEIGDLAESFNRLINTVKIMEALNKEK